MPRRPAARIKALQQTLGVVRTAIHAKRWPQARYALSRARALANALPADLTTQEREQLALLRKKFEARDTAAAKSARKPKSTATARAGGKKPTAKPTAKKSTAKATRTPTPDLSNRSINRAALGYTSADKD